MPRSSYGGSRYDDDTCSVLSAESALDKVDQVSSRLEVRAAEISIKLTEIIIPRIAKKHAHT